MSLYRWSLGFLRLGLLLLALGLLPELVATFFGFPSAITLMLQLTVAPLGAVILVAGALLWLVAIVRARVQR